MLSPFLKYFDFELLGETDADFLLRFGMAMSAVSSREKLLDVIKHYFSQLELYNDPSIVILNQEQTISSSFLANPDQKRVTDSEYAGIVSQQYTYPDGYLENIITSEKPLHVNITETIAKPNQPKYLHFLHKNGIKCMIGIPLHDKHNPIGALLLFSEEKKEISKQDMNLLGAMSVLVSQAISNIRAYEKIEMQLAEINLYKSQLEEENNYLQEQINTTYNYSEIIGSGTKIRKVFDMINMVAGTDSTVLIYGETGTGKELIARAIHNASEQKNKIMIKVNCATLPANLIESELFGHEKGSFTGAIERRIGKFELANNSTLFLDEIGEMPLNAQVKLLRVIQENEIERVGGSEVIPINVRIVAATNRNLLNEVQEGRFRSDLFYRLDVFPIELPPLRDRIEDIPILTAHFIKKIAARSGKKETLISKKALEDLIRYNWPGNIRELEHVIERSLLLATGTTIRDVYLPSTQVQKTGTVARQDKIKSIMEIERDHIIEVLNHTKWKISGKNGAASILNIPPTTLHSKMKRLNINK